MNMVILLVVAALMVGIGGWAWRINLLLNHPEKHEKLRQFEKEYTEAHVEAAKKIVAGGVKAANLGAKLAGRLGKK